jgi:NADPH-dependent 2,4-dienoyl-CoA reductase/sulfur reductase-like enzyme/nitrite reductase/ring-hydroxylating ferredoxin subunit
MSDTPELPGPDLTQGVPLSELRDGAILLGHAGGEAAILVRRGDALYAIGATCTHYGGPLAEGLVVEDTVRCPWHHACFDLRTGEALRAPALNDVSCWRVEQRDGKAYVREKRTIPTREAAAVPAHPASIVIVGGGAAGNAAAEMLRREGYCGQLILVSADDALPCDRPNLSKGYLAGAAPYEWLPLRSTEFYESHDIDLKLRTRVTAIDTRNREVQLGEGSRLGYDALLLATGAEPVRLQIPGCDLAHIHYLRTIADCNAIIDKAHASRRAVVIGSSFIGLEVAASLRQRDVAVDVVARESVPMEHTLGPEVGGFLRALHEAHGVNFHFGTEASAISPDAVTLKSGETLPADLVIAGIGVRPAVTLARQAGIAGDGGIEVNEYLETSVPGVFAAGDIARWPDPYSGERLRVEHWVVAERQGQTAARNMLGRRERFDAVPFFWTEQYDFGLAFVGYAGPWDKVEVDGKLSLNERNCTITYRREGRKIAAALIRRDHQGLLEEVEFEKETLAKERRGG